MNPTNVLAGCLRIILSLTWLMLAVMTTAPWGVAIGQDEVAADGSLSAEPYSVYVAQEEVFARCGPSGEFYRTDPLRHGQELEVYVETADGWLGIRPPEDSFCWIPASSLELSGSSDQATIVEDQTVAWIGTHLGRARSYRWQVQLAEGEPVTIVGKSERDGPDGPQMWYRIVPPSGEFRWVHRDQIVTSPEELVANIAAHNASDESIEFLPAPTPARTSKENRLASRENKVAREEAESISRESVKSNVSPASASTEEVASSRKPTKQRESRSILEQAEHNDAPVGSGVQDNWQANDTRDRVVDSLANRQAPPAVPVLIPAPEASNEVSLSSLAFVGSPRMNAIGTSYENMTPATSELASDSNWVGSGTSQVSQASYVQPAVSPSAPRLGPIAQAAYSEVPASSSAAVAQTLHVVDSEAVARVEAESNQASVEKLQLMLSRVMAAGAPSEEAEPIASAAERIARKSVDQLEARRAQAIADRTRQYQRVAQRRDGHRVSQSSNPPLIPTNHIPLSQATSPPRSLFGTPAILAGAPQPEAGDWITESGYLVQVYSARPNTPPFALTDNSGRTLAYVTPVPGTNLRMHLNNYIRVDGQRGFVNGMDTPHVMVSRVQRIAE